MLLEEMNFSVGGIHVFARPIMQESAEQNCRYHFVGLRGAKRNVA